MSGGADLQGRYRGGRAPQAKRQEARGARKDPFPSQGSQIPQS